jgi:lipopolysaccharide heptosyltransferase II
MKWKNSLIKGLIWLLSPEQTRQKPGNGPKRFLIVSTTALGDTLWSTPALRALRTSFPDAYIAVLTSPIGKEVLENNKDIDELHLLEKPHFFSLLSHFFRLKRQPFDAILLFHASQRALFPFCALLEPTRLIGSAGINKDLDFLFTDLIPSGAHHEIERRIKLVEAVGARVHTPLLHFPISSHAESDAARFLEGHGVLPHLPIIALHPGARVPFKQWPADSFVEVGKRLYQHLGCQVIVTGDHSEAVNVLEIASKIPCAIPMAGELTLEVFSALLKRLSLFITNDTGPMHLAFAMKTPTVAIFGPTDPRLCGPYRIQKATALSAAPTCAPCLKKKCAEPFCLRQIGPDAVYDAALKLYYSELEKV